MQGNAFAQIIIIAWPLVALALFVMRGRAEGLIWSTCLGYLFLPEAVRYELPGLPDYDKVAAIALGVLLGALFAPRQPVVEERRRTLLGPALMLCFLVLFLISPIATWLANTNPIATAAGGLPGLTWRDVVSTGWESLMHFTPLMAGLVWLRRPEHRRTLITALIVFAAIYSLMALFEMRMSPQFSNWVYGFFPHSWIQHYRNGFWRPVVFLRHGLWLGFFLFSAVMAAIALARTDPDRRPFALGVGAAFFLVLLLSQNLGALVLAMILAPLGLMATLRLQLRIAAVLGLIVLFYPVLHQAGLVPIDAITDFFRGIDANRAASLEVRLKNEAKLVDRALLSPWVGLGGWSRSLPLDDPGFLADGLWVLVWGVRGWLGYLATFGILVLPILALLRQSRHQAVEPAVAVLALCMSGNVVYLIVNSTLSPIGYLMTGALGAAALWRVAEDDAAETARTDRPRRPAAFTRFPDGAASVARHARRPSEMAKTATGRDLASRGPQRRPFRP